MASAANSKVVTSLDDDPLQGYSRYSGYSYWLETCGDDLTPRPALDGSIDVDVGILGAGFSGLWTAYYLLKRDPSLKVAVIEREIAGFGASGRNGGWCSGGFPVSAGELSRRYGDEATRALLGAMIATVDEVGRVAHQEDIGCDYVKGGTLRIARGRHQLPALDHAMETYRRLGLDNQYVRLDAAQLSDHIRVSGALGGLYTPNCAVIHPAKLVRGLARVVERLGGSIYEQTPVTDFSGGPKAELSTPFGTARARAIALCGESYLSRLPKLHRQLIPIYSLITLTEPLSDEQWAAIGWEGRETVSSQRYSVDYLSRTSDGRIAFGGRGAPYHLGSKIEDGFDRHEPTHQMLQRMTRDWFPMLSNVRFTHSWGGPLGAPRDWMPSFAFDPASGIATARGYTGQGVATTNLAGRILTDLILGTPSELTELPPVNHESPSWEPEPFRWLGVRYVQEQYGRIDERAARTGRAPTGRSLAERMGRH